MRDSSKWYSKVVEDLATAWPSDLARDRRPALCQVELGLHLLQRLQETANDRPDDSGSRPWTDGADGVYALLGGYPFAGTSGLANATQHHLLVNARHLLWRLRRRRTWRQYLDAYRRVPERLRAFDVADDLRTYRRRTPTAARDRFASYDTALAAMPVFRRDLLPIAGVGNSRFRDRGRASSVDIPEFLCRPPAPGHDLETKPSGTGRPLQIPRSELEETALWMDEEEVELGLPPGNWSQRLADVHLEILASNGRDYEPSKVLTLNGLIHLVGMVGAGKSTLMTLIAVWAARLETPLRTTLIVGDVAEQLRLTTLFRNLGLRATPVLGGSTRERHASRLHRRMASKGLDSLLAHHDPGFHDLSTACALDAQRGIEANGPLRYSDAPCLSLRPVKPPKPADDQLLPEYRPEEALRHQSNTADDDDDKVPAHGCPAWSVCPRHSIDRDMVDAVIWVANPASLLQSAVPRHLNAERLRRLELACLRSDIIIGDEADRIQMQLDSAFAPSATLVTRGPDSWLDRLHTHKIDVLARQGRLPLSDMDVEDWAKALDVVSAATNHIYAMLIASDDLRVWADTDYFSAWTLQEKLIAEWYPEHSSDGPDTDRDGDLYSSDLSLDPDEDATSMATDAPEPWADRRRDVVACLDAFRDDPLGDRGGDDATTAALVTQAHNLMHTLNVQGSRQRVRAVLDLLLAGSPILDGSLRQPEPQSDQREREPADIWGAEAWFERTAQRLEFTLLLAVLHHRLARLTFLWPQVEAALRLDSTDNELARRPPLDYAPVVPEAPMGNVLGFQYLPDEPEPGAEGRRSGTLRFFRCAGVGRELLLNLPSLGADPGRGRPGPHVLLMSGTSWAGTSTRAHVLAPVTVVLKPSDDALKAIRGTSFRTEFLYAGTTPLRLSGAKPEARQAILRQMIIKLGKSTPGHSSPLENELRQIPDPDRRRALLLVGSYRDATIAADLLEEIPRWRGKVRVLAADDAELDYADQVGGDSATHAAALRRGDLASFAEDPQAQILVAPLMAIERGHNILNSQRTAAFGSVFFLARPHPQPDDLSLAIFAINDWVTRFVRDMPKLSTGTFSKLVASAGRLDAAALALRHVGRSEWRRLLSRRYAYSQLNPSEKASFAWDQLVVIWQVIGRLVRGGVPARVVFVDAAFAPALAAANAPRLGAVPTKQRREDPGLLLKLHDILAPYFSPTARPGQFAHPADPALVKLLYQPLFDALGGLRATALAQLSGTSADNTEGSDHGKAL
ncbi:signal recognition particle [Catellatospora sp. NPDC049111]|uniref:pPIWI_RE_Z domain-containing protein n=1 Tax=Catellatospora sp. NPDC049111 TaxID=3155271 RepID=UPI0033EA5E22